MFTLSSIDAARNTGRSAAVGNAARQKKGMNISYEVKQKSLRAEALDADEKEPLLLSSKIGPVLANNFPPQLLKNLFSVSEAPALIIKVQYLALMRQPVQQSCCEDSVAKKLRPAIKAFI